MITQIDVMSDEAFEMPILGVTPKSSLLIKKVTGLNPPDRNLFIGDYSQDGGIYQGRRVGNRNVVFTIDLNPNPALGESVASLRQALYKAFIDPQTDGDYLKVVLHEDNNRETYLVGYCEKFETEIFGSETMCQISMICPDPYLRNNEESIHTLETGWVTVNFTYEGTAETGFTVRIYVTNSTPTITLHNNEKSMLLESPTTYLPDDLIIINTERGYRSITLTKPADLTSTPTEYVPTSSYGIGALVFYGPGVWKATQDAPVREYPDRASEYWTMISTPIVSHLSPKSQWLELHASDNRMHVYQDAIGGSVVANIKYLKYTPAYWGM